MINARAETVAEKPAFRDALRRRRCLVLADGFYEWQKTGAVRRPMRVVLRTGEPFAFAGLWSVWRDPDGNRIPVLRHHHHLGERPAETNTRPHAGYPAQGDGGLLA